jgi:hypothetical protein
MPRVLRRISVPNTLVFGTLAEVCFTDETDILFQSFFLIWRSINMLSGKAINAAANNGSGMTNAVYKTSAQSNFESRSENIERTNAPKNGPASVFETSLENLHMRIIRGMKNNEKTMNMALSSLPELCNLSQKNGPSVVFTANPAETPSYVIPKQPSIPNKTI